jgi:hypothetical protein
MSSRWRARQRLSGGGNCRKDLSAHGKVANDVFTASHGTSMCRSVEVKVAELGGGVGQQAKVAYQRAAVALWL